MHDLSQVLRILNSHNEKVVAGDSHVSIDGELRLFNGEISVAACVPPVRARVQCLINVNTTGAIDHVLLTKWLRKGIYRLGAVLVAFKNALDAVVLVSDQWSASEGELLAQFVERGGGLVVFSVQQRPKSLVKQ